MGFGNQQGDCARWALVERADDTRAADEAFDLASRRGNACQVLLAAVLEQEVDRIVVLGEPRCKDHSVELLGQKIRFAARRRGNRQMVGAVERDDGLGVRGVRDSSAIPAPARRPVGTGIAGDLVWFGAEIVVVGRNHPDVRVVVVVRIVGTVAHEGDPGSVGRPRGLGVVEVARGDLFDLFRREIEDV